MTRYLDLAEYLWLAEQVTGAAAVDLSRSGRIDRADSAIRAPQAGFGDEDFHPEIYDKFACDIYKRLPRPPASWLTLMAVPVSPPSLTRSERYGVRGGRCLSVDQFD